MLKLVVLMVMAGVLVLAATSNSVPAFGRDAGFDNDAPSGSD